MLCPSRVIRGSALAILLLVAPYGARAQGISMYWDDCSLGAPRLDSSQACNTSIGAPNTLVISVATTEAIDGVIGAEGSIVLQMDGPAIPDFWRLDAAGCRTGLMLASADAGITVAPYSCNAPWGQAPARTASATFHPWTVCGPNRSTILWSVSVSTPVVFAAGSEHYLLRLSLLRGRTTTCSGCETPACLAAQDVVLKRAADDPRGDVTVSATAYADVVTWQGGGTTCWNSPPGECPVPTRNSTWCRLKHIYR